MIDDIGGISGGEGTVVRAWRRTFPGDPVGYTGPASVKLLTEMPAERAAVLAERWERLAALRHPRLARALEVFQGPGLFRTSEPPPDADDVCYATTAWVEGTPLRRAAPVAPRAAVRLARDVADGLAALHGQGWVHRDLHPGNLVVGPDGRGVLIDFGSTRPDDRTTTMTVTGVVGFIAPDLLAGPGTASTDRWGLGMLTIFALLGHPQGSMSTSQLQEELHAALAGVADPRRAVELLTAMVDPEPARRPADSRRWARDLEESLTARPARRRLAAAAGAVVVVLAGAAGGLWVAQEDGEPSSSRPVSACPAAAPRADDPAADDPAADDPGTVGLAESATTIDAGVCPDGAVRHYLDARVQPLATAAGDHAGVLLQGPTGQTVHLTPAQWTSFRDITDDRGLNLLQFSGYPVAVERQDDPEAVLVTMSEGGMLVSPRDDTQAFWLHPRVLELWRSDVGADLGFPTSNPYILGSVLHMDFERGTLQLDLTDVPAALAGQPADIRVSFTDGAAQLGDVDALAGRIIQQRGGGPRWWVGPDGRRHWIPDTPTWRCLGGNANTALAEVPGWVPGALPLGDPATCP